MPVGSGTSFGSPLTESQRGSKYRYRHRMGLVACAEYDVFHDDFHSFVVSTAITNGPTANTPWGWQSAAIDSGGTNSVYSSATLGANGVIRLQDATAGEGSAFWSNLSFQLVAGKRFFHEVRIYTDDVTDNAFQFGLASLTATTNPEDLWTTVQDSLIAFGILDGSAYPQMLVDKSNSGSAVQTQTVKPFVASTWHTVAIAYDGVSVSGWIDGDQVMVWSGASSTIPTGVGLSAFVGTLNGNGGGGANNLIDYVRIVSER